MADLVIDASALLAVALQEEREVLVRVRLTGHQWHAPSILEYELANAIAVRTRRDPSLRAALLGQWQAMLRLPIHYHDIDPVAVLELALETGLTAYDAAYLWLAESLECELVTLDTQLESVASERA